MNRHILLSSALAALSASIPASAMTLAPSTAPFVKTFNVDAQSVQALSADFLKTASKGQTLSLTLSGKTYQYRVTGSHFEGDSGEVTLALVTNSAKKATFGVRGDYVSAFIETPKATYALGYSRDQAPVLGKADTQWTTPELAALPPLSSVRFEAIAEKPPIRGATPMTIDTDKLLGMAAGEEASLTLPGLGAVRVQAEATLAGGESTTWQGHLSDFGKSYTATITWNTEGMTGYVVTPQGDFTISQTANTGAYVWNPTALGLQHNERPEACAEPVPANARLDTLETAGIRTATAATTVPKPSTAKTTATPQKTLDILMYYSNGMLAKYGSIGALTAAVDNYVALTNQAYAAGGLAYTLRRVGLKPVNVTDTTDNSALLSQLTAGSGAFSVVAADRIATGADLVTVLRPLHVNTQKSCGVAYVGGYGSQLSQFPQYKNYMMSVLSDGVDLDAGKSYCDQLVLAHETGHNLGLMHDRATVAAQGGGTGVTPYAFGYAVPGKWGSIMSYTFPHVVRFSNPNDSTCGTTGKEVCGIVETSATSAHNIKALGLTLPIASGFVPATDSTTSPPPAQSKYTLAGSVRLLGTAVSGAKIQVTPATGSTCTTTKADGSFTCTLPAGTRPVAVSIVQKVTPDGRPITWSPASADVVPDANKTIAFTGTAPDLAKATMVFTFKYKNAPVAGSVKVLTGAASDIACATGATSTSCLVTPNKTYALKLGYTIPATQKAAVCTPSGLAGRPAPGKRYTFAVNCK